jgi:hypothetical protein
VDWAIPGHGCVKERGAGTFRLVEPDGKEPDGKELEGLYASDRLKKFM